MIAPSDFFLVGLRRGGSAFLSIFARHYEGARGVERAPFSGEMVLDLSQGMRGVMGLFFFAIIVGCAGVTMMESWDKIIPGPR